MTELTMICEDKQPTSMKDYAITKAIQDQNVPSTANDCVRHI